MDDYVVQAVAIATAITGLVAPLLTAVINRPGWTTQRRELVALAVSVALAVVALLLTGAFTEPITDVAAWGIVVLAVIGASQAIYALVLRTTGIAQGIERATTPARHRDDSRPIGA